MGYLGGLVGLIVFYLVTCKILPYFIFPNFFRKSKVERHKAIKKLAQKLKGKNKNQTLRNTYRYMIKTYHGRSKLFENKNFLYIFSPDNFSPKKFIGKRKFLWCFNHNQLLKSILVHTKQFKEEEIVIEKRFHHIFIHQWISIKLKKKKFTIDSYYKEFIETPLSTQSSQQLASN